MVKSYLFASKEQFKIYGRFLMRFLKISGFIVPTVLFLLIFNWALFSNINAASIIIGYTFIIALGLLFGFAINMTLNEIASMNLRKKKIRRLEEEYEKIVKAAAGLTQNDLTIFRIYCNTLMEI